MDLSAWYLRYGEPVLRRCRRLMADDALAHDLLQETFLRAHKHQRSYRGGSALSWLLTIADRACFDALKRRARLPVAADGELPSTVEALDLWPSAVRRDFVRTLLSHTDERTALIVIRRYFDELSLDDIAAELQLNEKTIRRSLTSFLAHARTFDQPQEGAHA